MYVFFIMANLSKVIYINEEDYSTLLNGGTITKGGVTYSHDPTALYVIKNVSAPEYAETAGYATTAGQATKATQDGDGNVIKDTYEKEQQVVIEFDGNDTTFPNLTDPEVRALCNDNSKTVILKDTSLRSQSTEGFPLYYRTEFTTDHWAFSSTYVEAAGAGWLIRLCWDQNHEAIVREFSDTKLYPSENVDLGQAYGISSDNSNAIRTSSISGFKLKKGGTVAIKFTTDINITNPSLNINSTGSKPIYYRGSTLLRGTVNAGDTVTFIYDGTYYHIISIDKDIPDPATTAPIMDGTATIGTSGKYAKEDHVHPSDTSRVSISRKINNKPLTGDITLNASDVGALPSNTHIPNDIKVGSVAGKLYRNDVNGGGNFTVKGNSGCIPNVIAGTFLVSIYAKSTTQSYTFGFNFGSVSYNLSTTNGEINDVREITIPSDGTFSGSILNGSVASGTILYVVMYNYLTPVSTVGVAAVTNRYSDLDGTPTIPTVPTNISSFTNDVGYITSTAITNLTDIL